jgi:hypothetical protein
MNKNATLEDADEIIDENGFYPLPHNPTQSFHNDFDEDRDHTPFMDGVARRLRDSVDALPYPSVLREFGGNGDCGPASLSGVLNFFRIEARDSTGERFSGGPSELRRVIVDLARRDNDLLHLMAERWRYSYPEGFEVRESTGLRMIHDVNDYLDHMLLEGSHFDEPAWAIAARVLNIQIVIHRVRAVNYYHLHMNILM